VPSLAGTRRPSPPPAFGLTPTREREAVGQLLELHRRRADLASRDGRAAADEFFFAEQNAHLVKNAEEYYRICRTTRLRGVRQHLTERRPAMIKRILCPVDFSDASRHAVEQAAAIAGWYRAGLTALHAYVPPFAPVPGLPAVTDRVAESELERIRDEMTTFCEAAQRGGTPLDIVIEVGHAARAILKRAESLPADLLVMGTHGASGFEHLVLGSITEKVLRKATCPVLTVPPRAHVTSRFPFTRVLCAVDFSDWSQAALDLAASLAEESKASLDVVHVLEWPWSEPPAPLFDEMPREQAAALIEFRRYLVTTAGKRLESLVSDQVGSRCAVNVRVVHGRPYMQILQTATDVEADLIVLGVHGRNPIDLTLFGSTTNHVVRAARCPVLTLRR
jgi:nucleotide-binding universal stress UspA family protein